MKKEMITVAMTGASGNMGQAVVEEIMKLSYVRIKLLLLNAKREHRLARRWTKLYGNRVEYFFGNITRMDDCHRLVDKVDYVVNMAAIIPPLADKRPDLAHDVNVVGVQNLVTAIETLARQPKLIHISTVAIYGHRDQQHPWGRVGDPLLPSAYDRYGMGKLIGERCVLDSAVHTWAVLRQTGILYEKLLMANISDGLMFHTCFNVPIEWTTDHDSGVLLKNIIAKDYHQPLTDFWNKVYNIGGGAAYRTTGYETFDMGFGIIGGSVEKFLKPNWYATRNFHCMWFADSDELERRFHFQSRSKESFWKSVKDKNKYFALAKLLPPKAISAMVLKPLLKDANAPYRWVKNKEEGRVKAAFGSNDAWASIGCDWNNYPLWAKNRIEGYDYREEIAIAYADKCRLSHGYDESKPESELDLKDLQNAARFRGGRCTAGAFEQGDWYTKVGWQCAEGHTFEASPYTVLKAGHWCPHCIRETRWNFDRLSKSNPYYAQVWHDTHGIMENNLYYIDAQGKCAVTLDTAREVKDNEENKSVCIQRNGQHRKMRATIEREYDRVGYTGTN